MPLPIAVRARAEGDRSADSRGERAGSLRRDLLGFALVGLVAAAFRLFRLAEAPPGLHHDEAVNGLDILVSIPSLHPIFFEANNGREPLFIYLQALAVQLLGPTALSLRLTAAVVGTLTVLVTAALAREWFGRKVGLLAGLGLAVSFWHVDLSRVGLRAIAAPLFLTLALLLLTRGLRHGRLLTFGLAGLAVGLGLYTYLSARLAPTLILAIVAWEVIRGGRALRGRWAGLLVLGLVAVAVAAPLARYFVEHPDSFAGRSAQVSIFNPTPSIEGQPSDPSESLRRTLGMFFVRGDDNPRHNLPGRPVFDPLAAPWLVLGLGVAGWQAIRSLGLGARGALPASRAVSGTIEPVARADLTPWPPSRDGKGEPRLPAQGVGRLLSPRRGEAGREVRPRLHADADCSHDESGRAGQTRLSAGESSDIDSRPAFAGWLLAWFAGMLALGALTHESPNYLRLTSLAPAVYLLWALGLAQAWAWLAKVPTRARAANLIGGLLALAVVGHEAGRTYQDYFQDWAGRPEVYASFDAGLVAVAQQLDATGAGAPSFLYLDRSPTVLYLSEVGRASRWLQGYTGLLLLPPGDAAGAVYYFPGEAGAPAPARGLFFAARPPDWAERDPSGRSAYVAYRLSRAELDSLSRPAVALTRAFAGEGGRVELLGYTLDSPVARPGERVGLILVWRQRGDLETIYAPYVHFVDSTGRTWGQDDKLGFAVGGWKDGDVFLSRHEWTVPLDTPPLALRIEGGMAVREFGWPPGPVSALGPPVELGAVRVERAGSPAATEPKPQIERPLDAELGAGLRLLGHSPLAEAAKPGDRLSVDLLWHAAQPPSRDALVELSLVDAAGQAIATSAERPAYGQYPTPRWTAGTYLRDPRTVTVPGNARSGSLQLIVRLLAAESGEPLGRVALGAIQVTEPPRAFALPKMQRTLDASFGGEIALRGFDLDQSTLKAPGTLRLTLYWQALQAPTRNYTVFTHLLNDRNVVVAQQDNEPAHGAAPTLGWLPGQVVADEYELKVGGEVPPGELLLEVGLYDATSGERLRVGDGEDRVILLRLPVGPAAGG